MSYVEAETAGVLLDHWSPWLLKQNLSLNVELINSVNAPRDAISPHCPLPPQPAFHVVDEDQKAGPHVQAQHTLY